MGKQISGSPRTVQALDRAFAILESLVQTAEGVSLSELSRSLNLAPQTLQSLLRTLQVHGWVVQESRGKPYRLGPAPALLHRRWTLERNVSDLVRPIVKKLSKQFGEYVICTEWTGGRLIPIVETRPDRELSVRGESFSIDRLHTLATGKVLLANLEEHEKEKVLASMPLTQRGPNSITKIEKLTEQLEVIHTQGYVVCKEEAEEGIVAVAVPVVSADGSVRHAIGTSLPLLRYTDAVSKKLIPALQEAAAEIAALLQ